MFDEFVLVFDESWRACHAWIGLPKSPVMAFKDLNFRELLVERFQAKQKATPELSMRKFAALIGVSPANLSDILNGRCGLSGAVAARIAQALEFSDFDRHLFVDLVESKHGRSKNDREAALERLEARELDVFGEAESYDHSELFKDWKQVAVLELVGVLKEIPLEASIISRRLGFQKTEAQLLLERLVQIGELQLDPMTNRLNRRTEHTSIQSPIPGEVVRGFHKQILTQAHLGLEQPIEERKYRSTVMSFDSSRIEEAREMIETFHREFFRRFEAPETADSIYTLGLQFFRNDIGRNEDS